MKGSFLVKKSAPRGKRTNVFADCSGLVVHDLLLSEEEFVSIQGLVRKTGISAGLVHKVINQLVYDGFVRTEGVRTAKKYRLDKPAQLLRKWLDSYSLADKCRLHTYNSGFNKDEIEEKLRSSSLSSALIFGLHSACRLLQCNFTNLQTTELYLLDQTRRQQIEKLLRLDPIDKGTKCFLLNPTIRKLLSIGAK